MPAKRLIIVVVLLLAATSILLLNQSEFLRVLAFREENDERMLRIFFSSIHAFILRFCRNLVSVIFNIIGSVVVFLTSSVTRTKTTTTITTTTPQVMTSPIATTSNAPTTTVSMTPEAPTTGEAVRTTSTPTMELTSSTSSTSTTSTSSTSTSTTSTSTTSTSTTSTTTKVASKVVFVTSQLYGGDLGGVEGADRICESLARNAQLSGTFLAWISNQTTSPNDRFVRSMGPYTLLNGDIFAMDYASLTSGMVLTELKIDENNNTKSLDPVWTSTMPSGGAGGENCNNWTDSSVNFQGGYGQPNRANSDWTLQGNQDCEAVSRVYCFEQ